MLWKRRSASSSRRFVWASATVAACAVATAWLPGCANFEHLTEVSETFPRASTCGDCHVAIYREWSESPHAGAYANAEYRAATDDYRFSECLGCHAPAPGFSLAEPEVRPVGRSEGVTCVACHLEEGKLSGPLDPTGKVAPHPIGVVPDRYHSSRLCGRCHEGTFAEWDLAAAADKQTCQQCHMPTTVRKVTQPTGGISEIIVAMESEVEQKQHLFAVVAEPPDGPPVALAARRTPDGVELTVTNRSPHRLPTGDFGLRIVTLAAEAVSADGTASPLETVELIKELGTALPAAGSRRFNLSVPDGTTALRVRLVRKGRGGAPDETLVDQEIPLP